MMLADINKAVVWMVSTCYLISKPSTTFTNTLGIVPSAPITIGITVIFMFDSFFQFFFSQSPDINLSFYRLSILFCMVGRKSPQFGNCSFFYDH